MKKQDPSIFNDVIGPVMRGPSSSHCAGSLRIGRLLRNLMGNVIREALIEYDPSGSLVTTHASQGTDMGLYSGFLGYETDDERMLTYREEIKKAGIKIRVEHVAFGARHPNTYRITLKNSEHCHQATALSLGGGMVEIIDIDGAAVSMRGDSWEVLAFVSTPDERLPAELASGLEAVEVSLQKCRQPFIRISGSAPIAAPAMEKIKSHGSVLQLSVLEPVLPIISHSDSRVPFQNCRQMIRFNQEKNLALWELAVAYESRRGNIPAEVVFEKMAALVRIMTAAIDGGLRGTEFANRILPVQSVRFAEKMSGGKLLDDPLLNRIILSVTALMEVKSSLGVIVAAPTAGACGTLPGAVIAAGRSTGAAEKEIVKAMLAAGLIGVFIAAQSTFAAEEAGCQAECGSASGMAAAGLVHLAGGDLPQALAAASLALQNSFGWTCDPIANRVEAPCLGKNVMAAANALACANMALAGFEQLIPLDEVLHAFDQAGRSLPRELRCTALGGLSITKTSRKIQNSLPGR